MLSNIIIITGAESTGKTQLAKQLSEKLNCNWIPELSRQIVENLNNTYTYSDVEHIAKIQIQQLDTIINNKNRELTIFDTGLIITKVWFDIVYNKCPEWLISTINNMPKILHLVCDTDIPWVYDPVRENGGEMREKLNNIYISELKKLDMPFDIVSGIDNLRLDNALKIINKRFNII
jgi:nicotinamide riboside kinase